MKNWRTFAAGVAGAVFEAVWPFITKGDFNLKTDWPYLAKAGGIALFGYLAKDAVVTGTPKGKEQNPAQASAEFVNHETPAHES